MSPSGTLPIQPISDHHDKAKDALQTEVSPPRYGPEDLRLAERVVHALRATGYGPLRSVEVSVDQRIVHIVGRVPSYYLKQLAQETAQSIPGTGQIRNGLVVTPSTRHHLEVSACTSNTSNS